jgi:hypothetical protein
VFHLLRSKEAVILEVNSLEDEAELSLSVEMVSADMSELFKRTRLIASPRLFGVGLLPPIIVVLVLLIFRKTGASVDMNNLVSIHGY